MQQLIEFIITTTILLIALKSDLKSREVNDLLWLIGGTTLIITIILFNQNIIMKVISFTIILGFITIIHLLGKINKALYIGDADLKALLFISLSMNNAIETIQVFVLALAISLLLPVKIALKNLIKKEKMPGKGITKIVLFFIAERKKITELNEFESPLEEIKIIKIKGKYKEKRRIQLIPLIEPRKKIMELKKLVKKGKIKNNIVTTPLLPFILFIFIAYVFIVFVKLI